MSLRVHLNIRHCFPTKDRPQIIQSLRKVFVLIRISHPSDKRWLLLPVIWVPLFKVTASLCEVLRNKLTQLGGVCRLTQLSVSVHNDIWIVEHRHVNESLAVCEYLGHLNVVQEGSLTVDRTGLVYVAEFSVLGAYKE